jgi:hypothetical protein
MGGYFEEMKERQHKYIPGDHLMICDECGLTYRKSEMSQRWDKAWVCKKDFDPRHPQEYVRGRDEDISVPVARPETETYITTPITQDDL